MSLMDSPMSLINLPQNPSRGRLYMIRILHVGGAPASALAEDIPLFLEALERSLHRGTSDARTELKNLSFGEYPQGILHSLAHDLIRSTLAIHRTEPVLKVTITAQDDAKVCLVK